eukprot:90786-Prorocentrum_minimum.AAC.1
MLSPRRRLTSPLWMLRIGLCDRPNETSMEARARHKEFGESGAFWSPLHRCASRRANHRVSIGLSVRDV